MAKKHMSRLLALSGAVQSNARDVNPHTNVLRSPSPSLNFTFGNGHGLPYGFSLAVYGPPGGGKSVIANAIAGQLHRDDDEAVVIKFNTEMRETLQLTKEQMNNYGIDPSRYIAFETNDPVSIFDRIEKDIAAEIQDGLPVKLIIIDSTNAIWGRRAGNADTIATQQIGDHALTMKEGLKRILPVQRRHNIALIMTCHVTAEMDPAEQMRGNKFKMSAGNGLMHHTEYFLLAEPNKSKAGRQDLLGNDLIDKEHTDLLENGDRTGHKIRVTMKKSSMGPANRTGEFTFDYHTGIINMHEEVFLLGYNRGVIERDGTRYSIKGVDEKFNGKAAFLEALRTRPDMQEKVTVELRRADMAGEYQKQADGVLADKEESA